LNPAASMGALGRFGSSREHEQGDGNGKIHRGVIGMLVILCRTAYPFSTSAESPSIVKTSCGGLGLQLPPGLLRPSLCVSGSKVFSFPGAGANQAFRGFSYARLAFVFRGEISGLPGKNSPRLGFSLPFRASHDYLHRPRFSPVLYFTSASCSSSSGASPLWLMEPESWAHSARRNR